MASLALIWLHFHSLKVDESEGKLAKATLFRLQRVLLNIFNIQIPEGRLLRDTGEDCGQAAHGRAASAAVCVHSLIHQSLGT